jgi:hypothetical protein
MNDKVLSAKDIGVSGDPKEPALTEQRKSLLVIKSEQILSHKQAEMMRESLGPIAYELGFEVLILDSNMSAEVHRDTSKLEQTLALLAEAMDNQTHQLFHLVEQNAQLIEMLLQPPDDEEMQFKPSATLDG